MLAVMTSFLGTALSLSEFFMEQLGNLQAQLRSLTAKHHSSERSHHVLTSHATRAGTAATVPPLLQDGGSRAPVPEAMVTSDSSRARLRAAAFALVLIPSVALSCNIEEAFFTASEAAVSAPFRPSIWDHQSEPCLSVQAGRGRWKFQMPL